MRGLIRASIDCFLLWSKPQLITNPDDPEICKLLGEVGVNVQSKLKSYIENKHYPFQTQRQKDPLVDGVIVCNGDGHKIYAIGGALLCCRYHFWSEGHKRPVKGAFVSQLKEDFR